MHYTIRTMKTDEYPLLKEFTYHAIFQRDLNNLVSKDILNDPRLRVFYENFGKAGDLCLVAMNNDEIIGAVWTRILAGEIKGFGNIDHTTPEFAISLLPAFRGLGIGTKLMLEMLNILKRKGYKRASLAVQKDNYALKMYKAVGFSIVKELEEEFVMVRNFM